MESWDCAPNTLTLMPHLDLRLACAAKLSQLQTFFLFFSFLFSWLSYWKVCLAAMLEQYKFSPLGIFFIFMHKYFIVPAIQHGRHGNRPYHPKISTTEVTLTLLGTYWFPFKQNLIVQMREWWLFWRNRWVKQNSGWTILLVSCSVIFSVTWASKKCWLQNWTWSTFNSFCWLFSPWRFSSRCWGLKQTCTKR